MSKTSSIRIIRAGEGEAVWAMGEKIIFKLGPEDTGGTLGLAEVVAQPRNGPPPHLHLHEDELFFVIDGDFDFVLEDRTFTRSTGYATCLPKRVLHTYTNIGQLPGRLLVLTAPCGFERFIRSWARPVTDSAPLPPVPMQQDIDALMAAAPRFGIELYPNAKVSSDLSKPAIPPSYWVLGQFVIQKLTGRDTAGQFSVAEVLCPPGTSVMNHVHVAADELFYVLSGTAEFTFADHVEFIEAGGTVFVPRGQVHGFRNRGNTPVRLFDVHTPAGFENFFQEVGVPADPNIPPPMIPPPSPEEMAALLRKHGMQLA